MSVFTKVTKSQAGALYVEAAIIMPVLLLVTFASIFFLLVAARHFSLQMLANEIAKDVSLSLQPVQWVDSYQLSACIPKCMQSDGQNLRDDGYANTVDLADYVDSQLSGGSGCWSKCAAEQYLLVPPNSNGPYKMSVTVTAHPKMQFFDETLPYNGNMGAAGDFFEVSVAYPLRAVLGGGIAFFGVIPASSKIYGNAVGVIDKREIENQ
jgi:hypothetical protein